MKVGSLQRGAGFTLIEVMATMMLMTVMVLGIWGLQGSLARMNGYSSGLTEATAMAQAKTEELKSLPLETLDSGFDAAGIFQRTWTVTTGPAPGTRNVNVQVTWQRLGGTTNTVRLVTLRR